MKLTFIKTSDSSWQIRHTEQSFDLGRNPCKFRSEEHWDIQTAIKETFPDATFMTGRHIGTQVILYNEEDAAYFNIWSSDGIEI